MNGDWRAWELIKIEINRMGSAASAPAAPATNGNQTIPAAPATLPPVGAANANKKENASKNPLLVPTQAGGKRRKRRTNKKRKSRGRK